MTFPGKKSVPFQLSTLFGDVVIPKQKKAKPKASPPFSLRLTVEERSRLDQDAGNVPLGAYIRSRLFDDVYYSTADGLAESRAVFLAGCGLPAARRFVMPPCGWGSCAPAAPGCG